MTNDYVQHKKLYLDAQFKQLSNHLGDARSDDDNEWQPSNIICAKRFVVRRTLSAHKVFTTDADGGYASTTEYYDYADLIFAPTDEQPVGDEGSNYYFSTLPKIGTYYIGVSFGRSYSNELTTKQLRSKVDKIVQRANNTWELDTAFKRLGFDCECYYCIEQEEDFNYCCGDPPLEISDVYVCRSQSVCTVLRETEELFV
jgi:hypothetical protein